MCFWVRFISKKIFQFNILVLGGQIAVHSLFGVFTNWALIPLCHHHTPQSARSQPTINHAFTLGPFVGIVSAVVATVVLTCSINKRWMWCVYISLSFPTPTTKTHTGSRQDVGRERTGADSLQVTIRWLVAEGGEDAGRVHHVDNAVRCHCNRMYYRGVPNESGAREAAGARNGRRYYLVQGAGDETYGSQQFGRWRRSDSAIDDGSWRQNVWLQTGKLLCFSLFEIAFIGSASYRNQCEHGEGGGRFRMDIPLVDDEDVRITGWFNTS